MTVLAGGRQCRPVGRIGLGIGRSRRRSGEGLAAHPGPRARHQQLRAGAHQGGSGVAGPGRCQVGQVHGGLRVGREPVQDGRQVQRTVGDEPQRPRQNHLLQRTSGLVQPVQGGPDPGPVLLRRGQRLGDPHVRQRHGRPPRRGGAERHRHRREQRGVGPQVEGQRTDHHVGRAVAQCRGGVGGVGVARRDPVGDHRPGGPAQHEGRRRHVPVTGSRWLVIPSPDN